jgi:hypothetical protein
MFDLKIMQTKGDQKNILLLSSIILQAIVMSIC